MSIKEIAELKSLFEAVPRFVLDALLRDAPGGPKGAKAPWVVALERFVSEEEAMAFRTGCADQFSRSLAGDQLSPVRTSQQCWYAARTCIAVNGSKRFSRLGGANRRA